MHPDLQLLEQRYRALVDDVNAGHVSPQDAMVTMAGLITLDASGATWSIDPYTGQFTRAMPGSPPSPADPSQFSSSSGGSAMPGSPMSPVSAWDSPAASPVPRAGNEPASSGGSRLAFLSSITQGRGRVIAVAVVAVLAILALVLLRPSPQEAGPDSEPSSSATPTDSPQSPAASPDPSPSADPAPEPSATTFELPSKKRQDDLVRLLSGGDRQSLLNQLAPEVSATRVLLSAAPISGAARLGFAIRGDGAASNEEGAAVLRVTVSSPSGVLQTFRVPLSRVDEGWRISGSISLDAK